MKKLRELTEEDLLALPWLPDPVARATFAALHGWHGSPRSGSVSADDGRVMIAAA